MRRKLLGPALACLARAGSLGKYLGKYLGRDGLLVERRAEPALGGNGYFLPGPEMIHFYKHPGRQPLKISGLYRHISDSVTSKAPLGALGAEEEAGPGRPGKGLEAAL